jgi:anti-anti-sigma factor
MLVGKAKTQRQTRGGIGAMDLIEHSLGEKPDRCPVCGREVGVSIAGGASCPQCGHMLWFISRQLADVTVIHLIDSTSAVMEMLDVLDGAVEGGFVGRLVINFGGIPQVSSAALGKLVRLKKHADAVRGKLVLCNLHADLRPAFRITHLDEVFEIHETEVEALAALGVAELAEK